MDNINADFKYGGRVRTEIVRLGIDINGEHGNETDFHKRMVVP
jgi:hypothetical protein